MLARLQTFECVKICGVLPQPNQSPNRINGYYCRCGCFLQLYDIMVVMLSLLFTFSATFLYIVACQRLTALLDVIF